LNIWATGCFSRRSWLHVVSEQQVLWY
jgi:hypothetical protein